MLHADARARFARSSPIRGSRGPENNMAFADIKDQIEIANLCAYLSHFNADGSSQ